jgi:peptide/nickel transport system permease protein
MRLMTSLWKNSAIRFGTVVLGLLLLAALAAPVLGTVDPAAMDAAQINTPMGTQAEFSLQDGRQQPHTFWFGADSYGRDI